jgi:hypothetical protein
MVPYSHSRSVASNPDRNSAPTSSPPDLAAADAVPMKCWAWSIRSGRRPLNVFPKQVLAQKCLKLNTIVTHQFQNVRHVFGLWVRKPVEVIPFRQPNATKGVSQVEIDSSHRSTIILPKAYHRPFSPTRAPIFTLRGSATTAFWTSVLNGRGMLNLAHPLWNHLRRVKPLYLESYA